MDISEVTVQAFGECVAAQECTEPDAYDASDSKKHYCNWKQSGRANHPINCVDWKQAGSYCRWVVHRWAVQGNYDDLWQGRLPDSSAWWWAAGGGGMDWKYPWGLDEPKDQLCWDGDGNDLGKGNRKSTCAVGSYPSGDNPWGMKDLAGNVREWTSTPLSYPFPGATEVFYPVNGGSWRSGNLDHRSVGPSVRVDDVGFRCASLPWFPAPGPRRPAPAQEMPSANAENAVPRTTEENAAIECAKGFAKEQNLYKDESTITAEQKNALWVVTFVQPGLAPTSRGGSYEVFIHMPVCELVRLIVLQ